MHSVMLAPPFLALFLIQQGSKLPSPQPSSQVVEQPGILIDGRLPLPNTKQELSDEEVIPLLRQLFPRRPAEQLSQQGSFRGSFTEKGRDQVFLMGLWEDPDFNGASAVLQGEARCGVFENGRMMARRNLRSARVVVAFRSVDLDRDGLQEVLAHSTYVAHNMGDTELWVLGARNDGLHEWVRRDVVSYLMYDDAGHEDAWEIQYKAGPLGAKRSYLIRQFVRSMGIRDESPSQSWKEVRANRGRAKSSK